MTVEVAIPKPSISMTTHKDYKHSKAVHSSRSFLTSVAVEIHKVYPITNFVPSESWHKNQKRITIANIFQEKYTVNPKPRPEFASQYKLKDFFTDIEWKELERLNDLVNPELHEGELDVGIDGESKMVILPIQVSHQSPIYQRVAKKANVVFEVSKLIVKNEGSVSGRSFTSHKSN